MNTQEKIEVMQAFLRGEEIEFRWVNNNEWQKYPNGSEPQWDWCKGEYRVKPKFQPPKELIIDFDEKGKVIVDTFEGHKYVLVEENPWIEWKGGENPAGGKMVIVKVRNGGIGREWLANYYRWNHDGTDGDIIAYRVV
jgi:hypothetical protein